MSKKESKDVIKAGGVKNHWLQESFINPWTSTNQDDEEAIDLHRRTVARRQCKDGNPWPLVAYQWPHLVITDPEEAKFFEGEIGNSTNPCLRIDWWQRLGVNAAFNPSYAEIFFKGNRGAGKTCIVGLSYCLYFDVYDTLKAHVTSKDYNHTKTYLLGEVKSWYQKMKRPAPARLLHDTINGPNPEDKYIRIINPASNSQGEEFSGIHPKADGKVIFAFDESSGVRKLFYENALDGANLIFAMSNPRTTIGWFRDAFRTLGEDEDEIGECLAPKGKRLCITVGGLDCANVRNERLRSPVGPPSGIVIEGKNYEQGEQIPRDVYDRNCKPLIGGQIDLAMYRQIRNHPEKWWGDCFADGKFIKEDADLQIILGSWLKRHVEYWDKNRGEIVVEAFGFDAARSSNGDDNVLAIGGRDGCWGLEQWKSEDTLRSADQIIEIAKRMHIDLTLMQHPVAVDVVGVGAGVADALRARNVWVLEHHAGKAAQFWPKECQGLRTESYHMLGRRLSPHDFWADKAWALPPDELLAAELVAPLKVYKDGDRSRFRLEPKETVKQKLQSGSPDRADAVMLLWYAVFLTNNYYDMLKSYQGQLVTSLADMTDEERESYHNRKEGGAATSEAPTADLVSWIKDTYGGSATQQAEPTSSNRDDLLKRSDVNDEAAKEWLY